MKVPMGPHQRRGRRRRRCKALIIAALLLMLPLVSSWLRWTPPALPDEPSIQELAVARKQYEISGDRGWAHIYLEDWREHAAYIRGEAALP